MRRKSKLLIKDFEKKYDKDEDYRDVCIWYENGYCKLDSKCINGNFFSTKQEKLLNCDLFDLDLTPSAIMERIIKIDAEIKSILHSDNQELREERVYDLSDLALGKKFLEKVLKSRWKDEFKKI